MAYGGIAPEVLIGHEEDFFTVLVGPAQRHFSVARRTDRAAVASREAFDCCGGIHVGHGDRRICDASGGEYGPTVFDLCDCGHVGHRTAGGEVRQNDCLVVGGQNVGAFGHEVHTAEDDEFSVGSRGRLTGKFVGIPGDVGELDDLFALVVVTENESSIPQRGTRRTRSIDEVWVGGRRQISGALDAALAVGIGTTA